jgi:heme-degrading monooxygenase HmoA
MMSRIRVLVFRAAPADSSSDLEQAYHQVSQTLQAIPGLLGNELLRSVTQPNGFVIMSEWESLEAYLAWENDPVHGNKTSPLRPYLDPDRNKQFEVYEVIAAYGQHLAPLLET